MLSRGDIVRVSNGVTSRIMLILDVDGDIARVSLMSNDVDYACDRDIVLTREMTGWRIDLMVETDLTSYIFVSDAQPFVACGIRRLPEVIAPGVTLSLIEGACNCDVEIPLQHRGTPIHGPQDPRWNAKLASFRELQSLTGDCVRTILDD